MSNTPDADPIGHAAKFVAIFAAIPVIFGAMALALPRSEGPRSPAATAAPFVTAALLLVVAFGVHRRSVAAAWIGIGLFAVGIVGALAAGLLGGRGTMRSSSGWCC